MTKFDSRLRQQCSKLYNIAVGVLSLAPCYVRKKQVQVVDQTTHPPKCHSFVGLDRQIGSSPPANVRLLEMKKFYICSDVTHTHPACSGVWFWKIVAVEVGITNQIKWTYTMLVYKAAVISLRREIRFELKYLDRFAEAHALDSPPCVVDFSRCHSRRQSVWKLFG